MCGGGPDRPEVGCGPKLELLEGEGADPFDKTVIRESPSLIERGDVLRIRIHAFTPSFRCSRRIAYFEPWWLRLAGKEIPWPGGQGLSNMTLGRSWEVSRILERRAGACD